MSTPPGGYDPQHLQPPHAPGDPYRQQPPGAPAAPAAPSGYYPQQAYYAPGWQAPVGQVPPPRPRRRGLRESLAVVASLVIIGIIVGITAAVRFAVDTRPLGAVEGPVTVAARRVDVGHCICELPADGDVGRVQVVPCGDPHVAEVVASLPLPAGAWPGQAAVDDAGVSYCEMDRSQVEAGFRAVVWGPSEGGWGQGDHRVVCLAWSGGPQVTGSFTTGDEVAPA